ncbi:DUF3825 domain-containing protein [Agromyces mariniharenae]|uniref:DUF3825 domain-containing protein n=1 Tax=Agromyces mariniharenae TaxID=2604423 RepID=A0A5S4V517_9MICO|nr:DUF3825 domain-containing protein [Agromyces mariniharenae]TYL54024.1 DUF3825 domain-containing protein [Agromyces mariniharenae]
MSLSMPSPLDIARREPANKVPIQVADHPEAQRDTIRRFAFFAYRGTDGLIGQEAGGRAWADALEALSSLAEPEEWIGGASSLVALPILDSYVRYTYQRLVMEDKIVTTADNEYAAFNTGLLTQYTEDIFALFQRNRHPSGQPWYFLRWATESDRDIMMHFPEAPQMTEYVTNAGDLVYDWRRDLKLNFEHILGDNIERFPPELAKAPHRARAAITAAIEVAIKRVRRNHKLVVPQWYPRLHDAGAQFLMPLDLTGDGKADLALVVSAVGDSYRGNTVLTLEMAYTNARLVARPDSEWLKPQAYPAGELDDVLVGG